MLRSAELFQCLVECRANQSGERRKPPVVILDPVGEDTFLEDTGVWIAAPGVHGITRRRQAEGLDGLRETRIAVAGMTTKLHECRRTERIDDPERKRRVLEPGWRMDRTFRCVKHDRPVKKLCALHVRGGLHRGRRSCSSAGASTTITASRSRFASCSRQDVESGMSAAACRRNIVDSHVTSIR